jgi:MarR family transcriptional regulator for hemolysin
MGHVGVSGDPPRKTRLQQRRGPKPAAKAPRAGAKIKGLMYGGFSVDLSDEHLKNYHRFDADSEADDDHFRTTRALVVAARRWRKLANDRLRPMHQTMARWETLYLVAYSEEELNQGQLSRLLGVQGPTMVRMLDSLAREGLIERRQSHQDLRVTINRITDKGREVISSIMGLTNALRHEVLAEVEPSELKTTVKVLSQILRTMDKLELEGCAPQAADRDDDAE